MEQNDKSDMHKSDSKKSIDLANKVKSTLAKYRMQFEKNWREEEEAYHGQIWRNSDGYRPYENHVFKIIESEVPILTDSYPGVTFRTHVEEMKTQVDNLRKSVDWVFKNQNMQLKLPMVVRDSLTSAPGYLMPYYDANANDGQGEIKIDQVPWRGVLLNGSTLFLEDCESARIERDKSKTWLKLNYPNFKKQIEKMDGAEKVPTETDANRGREMYDTGDYGKRVPPKPYMSDQMLKLVFTYIKDYSTEKISDEITEEELNNEADSIQQGDSQDVSKWQNHPLHIEYHNSELDNIKGQFGLPSEAQYEDLEATLEQLIAENPEAEEQYAPMLTQYKLIETHIQNHMVLAEENPDGHKLKYRNGLRVIESLQELVLYDGESRDEHGQIPLVPYYCYRNGTIYGFGELRNILDSQRMQATLQYKEYKGLQRVANPIVIVDEETGLEAADMTNEDGGVYVIPQGSQIRHLAPGQVSPQIGQFNDTRIAVMQDISGVNEATQGKEPSPNASGIAIERKQQQAIGRIRLKDRQNQEYSMKRLGKLTASLVVQYWAEEKTLAVEGNETQADVFVFNPIEMQDLTYEVDVAPGSMAGIDKASFNYMLSTFLDKGNISFDQFLQVAELPRAEKLRTLTNESEQMNAQLQELRNENILLKAANNVEMLDEEEMQIYEQLMREKAIEEAQTGSDNGQPIPEGQ